MVFKNECDCKLDMIHDLREELEKAKSEAVKEFVKKFEKKIKNVQFTLGQAFEIQSALKETKKEMVGDADGCEKM